jgi:hypothetical protein
MALLEGTFVLLMMVMSIDCPPVPVPEIEEARIIDAAHKARSAEISRTEFESISVTKCISYRDQDKSQAAQDRTESVNFYGEFPQDIQTDRYSERRYIRCHMSIDYRDNAAVKQRDGCTEVLSRRMQHQGLEHEVILREGVSVEDATAYLDYLLNYDFGNHVQSEIQKVLQSIQWIDVVTVRGQVIFHASFNHSGCATTTFEATAIREQTLVFGAVYDGTGIC